MYQNSSYLVSKRGVFYYTRRVPKELLDRFGKDRVRVCLHTRSDSQALRAAAQLSNQLEAVWGLLRIEKLNLGVKFQHNAPVNREKVVSSSSLKLSDALSIYLRLKGRGKGAAFKAYSDRNLGYVIDCLGDKLVESLGRADAGQFRDFLIKKGLASASIKRVFATVRAAVNLGISEFGLNCPNPFSGTYIPDVCEKKIRLPISPGDIAKIQRNCIDLNDDNRWLIALISDTGMRLAEAVGLAVNDIKLSDPIPHIDVHPQPWRPLKTPSSTRVIPLVGVSLWAATCLVNNATGDLAFPRYASKNGANANSASAALNQWLRARLPPGNVIHSFRHSMRDRLRAIECPADIVDAIGGWTTQGIGHGYGSGYPLDVKHRWLEKLVLIKYR